MTNNTDSSGSPGASSHTEDNVSTDAVKLTQYSRGAGCGCKISPKLLEEMLQSSTAYPVNKNLLVGNSSKDDAAVYDTGDGNCVISTTDFFMPIVDDAFDFGRIASANAISDVYAMGGKPLMAIAILGWPVEKLPAALAQQVLEGARTVCAEAGIPLAGGHSIDSTEPIFGLAVTGIVHKEHLKQNSTAGEGDVLFLTKPIGVGILSTAQKRGVLTKEHQAVMIGQMAQLNKWGEQLGKITAVTAMTDITGFGLLGHLIEMAEAANLSAEIYYSKIQVTEGVKECLAQRTIPDATFRNWNSYSTKVGFDKGVNVMEAFSLLPDPQTNGGLLFSVKASAVEEIKQFLEVNNLAGYIEPIGKFIPKTEKLVQVKN
jgi:selenide,water dikinase